MKTERGTMEYIGVLLIICAVCVIGVVFLWARSQDSHPSDVSVLLKSMNGKIEDFNKTVPTINESISSVNSRIETAMQNVAMLRLEVESLKSQIVFPQKQELLLKQDKAWEIHLLPERKAKVASIKKTLDQISASKKKEADKK